MPSDARERPRRTDSEEVDQMLVRLPKTLSKALRARAYEEERPKVAIIRDALTQYLAK